jgi:hypothetical protein
VLGSTRLRVFQTPDVNHECESQRFSDKPGASVHCRHGGVLNLVLRQLVFDARLKVASPSSPSWVLFASVDLTESLSLVGVNISVGLDVGDSSIAYVIVVRRRKVDDGTHRDRTRRGTHGDRTRGGGMFEGIDHLL